MRWFINLTTRSKLFLSFGFMMALLAIVVVTAYVAIKELQESEKTLFERDFNVAVDLVELRADANRQRARMLEMILKTRKSDQEAEIQEIKAHAKEIDQLIQSVFERGRNDTRFLARLEELKATLQAYRQTRDQQMGLIFEGKVKEAMELSLGSQDERFEKIRSLTLELGSDAVQKAKAAIARSQQSAVQSTRIFVLVGVVALLLMIFLASFLSRNIAVPLKEISSAAERIASGDLRVAMSPDGRRDEIGVLMKTFRRMVQSLQEMAEVAKKIAARDLAVKIEPRSPEDLLGNAFVNMLDDLRDSARQITEGTSVLGSAASQIVAAAAQVASGAAETATAISETTTTVEEVKQTAQVASQKAKYVSESAHKSLHVSQVGRKSVEETISGMNRIREQMDSIAETITKLSEQGQTIGEITGTVNDLADQATLLAVNAAIEAAKAGEHGVGFSVVAQEIRSLADQSKQATAQVRTILSEIQKATSAAVLATEQGSKAVEAGVKQSNEAAESIRILAESMVESAQAATQIAASSQQQSVGMDQVALAMENIKQAATQNVASTKQTETSAQNLQELGQQLRRLVERYKL
jgi:methyl-accepting chemotaxis protein